MKLLGSSTRYLLDSTRMNRAKRNLTTLFLPFTSISFHPFTAEIFQSHFSFLLPHTYIQLHSLSGFPLGRHQSQNKKKKCWGKIPYLFFANKLDFYSTPQAFFSYQPPLGRFGIRARFFLLFSSAFSRLKCKYYTHPEWHSVASFFLLLFFLSFTSN